MPLVAPHAPSAALHTVTTALGDLSAVGGPRPALSTEAAAANRPLTVEHPLPVHVLAPQSAAGAPPRVRLSGWRFLIRDGERLPAAAEAVLTTSGWAFSHFSGGPYLASTERALAQAEALTPTYQPRLLSVPGLYMLCLWLHGDTADGDEAQPAAGDLLVPLSPAPPGIAAHRPYRVEDLLPLLAVYLTPPAPAQAYLKTAV